MSEAKEIREAIIAALSSETSGFGKAPQPGRTYVPRTHLKALKPEANLVVGARGVGKSFWTAALYNWALRTALEPSVDWLRKTKVGIGFAEKKNSESYPETDTFTALLREKGYTPYEIWRAVVARWAANALDAREGVPTDTWAVTTDWIRNNSESFAKCVERLSAMFRENGRQGLLVFDALDRTSHDWRSMDEIVKDLLRVVLWLKGFPAIHAKVFLREDQYGRTVTNFPDASKLLATRAELTWQPHDLHGLLWQLLCNAPANHGELLREVYAKICGKEPQRNAEVWSLTDEAKKDGPVQKDLFKALAGPWMGKDRRRGVPYVWSVSHLADCRGQTSPRSFLAAVRTAAENSRDKYPEHEYALHYESIKRGVQEASEIRIAEMAEDYPWVKELCAPLAGLNVPCEFAEVGGRWQEIRFPQNSLPPPHAGLGDKGYAEDLKNLGVVEMMRDGRINMPDLYRVGFGLGRKGGVKPVRRD